MIEAENASFTYQSAPSPALQDVTLTVQPGECVVLCGRSGCGKTTITRLVNGLIPQFYAGELAGSVLVDGQEISKLPMYQIAAKVGSVFQNPKTQYFNVDTTAELAFPCENAGMEPQAIRRRVDEVVEQFQLGPLMDRSVFKLSGGEKQRVAFAAACMLGPRLLVLDEPTNDLDIVTLGILEEYLQAFKGCVIVVSHDRYFVDKVADHLLVFCGDGEIREFAGTYSDYTAWKRDYEAAKQAAVAQEKAKSTASGSRGGEIRKSGTAPAKTGAARKLTFQEKREMEHLEAEIPELEQKKAAIEEKLSSGDLPFEELTALSEQITALMDQIDTKSMRWLELNEIGG